MRILWREKVLKSWCSVGLPALCATCRLPKSKKQQLLAELECGNAGEGSAAHKTHTIVEKPYSTTIFKPSVNAGESEHQLASELPHQRRRLGIPYVLGIKYILLPCLSIFKYFLSLLHEIFICLNNWLLLAVEENWSSIGIF